MSPAIVALPFAGGTSWSYRPLEAVLPGLTALEYPGHGRRLREPLRTSLHELAEDVVTQLRDRHAPFVLLGHSLGAQVSAFAAHVLLGQGRPLRGLILSGSLPIWRRELEEEPTHLLDDVRLLESVRDHQWNTEALDDLELRELVLPILRADYEAASVPVDPPPAVDLPVLALGGEDDQHVERMGEWRGLTTGSFALDTFPGGHFFLLDESRDAVSARVREYVAAL